MSDCDDGAFHDRLPDLMHGRLAPDERARVEAHVASCDECAAELELLRAARGAYSHVPVIDTSRIAAAVVRRTRRAPARSVWQRPAWRIAAAISVISVGGLSLAIARSGIGGATDSALVAAARDSGPGAPAAETTGAGDDARTLARATVATPVALTFGGGLADLSDDELRALIVSVDRVEATPAEEPEQLAPVMGEGGTSE